MNPPKSCMVSHLTGKRQEKQENRGGPSTEAAGVQQAGEQQLRMHQKREGRGSTRDPKEPRRLHPKTVTTLVVFSQAILFSFFFNVYDKQWRRKGQPTPVFLPGEVHGQRSLTGYSPWGHKESDMTEQLTQYVTNTHLISSLICILF